MKKLFLCLSVSMLLINSVKSQSFKFKTITADVGTGFGIYGIKAYSPINHEEHDGIGIVGTLPTINAEFGLARFFGIGAHYRRGTYGKNSSGKIRGNDICLMANFHLANKGERFDLPIGVGYGFSNMKAQLSATEHLYAKGGMIRVQVAPHFYFSKYVGMFVALAYNKHLYNKLDVLDGSGRTYTEADGATWKMGGIEFNFGIAGKF
ncbi:MAG: hypothetical protein JST26_15100 [Bacteroidetes bacterium]|nr:hypothetical protein [Bacteroidota bacterium]